LTAGRLLGKIDRDVLQSILRVVLQTQLFFPKDFSRLNCLGRVPRAPPTNAFAQSFKSELETAEKVSLLVTSRNGRVSVIASDDQQKKVTIEATSSGLPVDPGDVVSVAKGASINIDVRPRREQDRIDVVVRIPSRSKVVV